MPVLDLDLWLKPEEVEPEAELILVGPGKEGEIPGEEGKPPTKTFEIKVQIPSGEHRIWTMNKTSQRAVAQSYGLDYAKWYGKPVKVYVSEGNVRGTMRKIIYARVPQPVTSAPPPGFKVPTPGA